MATETSSELLISLSVPGTTITPVPMTKLPNSSGHRTAGRAARAAAPAGVVFTEDKMASLWEADPQRLTCSAPGFTMLVGVPLMKLTTLSKAAPKYIS